MANPASAMQMSHGMQHTKLRIAGVPEHFNTPWHIAKEKGLFAAAGVDVEWTDYPGGTGAMTKALNDNEVDVALLLTEGAAKDIAP
ncbi:hypothetical protein T484DRAFT_1859277 [Baffinella frigidus]|nr:hypothetical protein T484DRAFT_1859277 [Cryptophyta sp. CCMP2293]